MPHWTALHAELRRSLARPGVPPEVVDDLAQDAAERLMRGLPRLRDPERLGPYVKRVAWSVWVDHLRRQRPHEVLPAELTTPEPPLQDLAPEVASWLPHFVDQLPERYREPVRLSELEGMSQREIASRLGLSASGARTRVQRGRRMLRESLEACCNVEREGARVTEVSFKGGRV